VDQLNGPFGRLANWLRKKRDPVGQEERGEVDRDLFDLTSTWFTKRRGKIEGTLDDVILFRI